ncbi:MAG: hypothetical protein RJB61_1765, partial [Actinomycetota bacterium]
MTVLTTVGSTVPVIPLSIVVAPAAAASIAETPPSVTAIARSAADGSAAVQLTAANTLYWKVTFTEDVTGVDETDFSLSRTAGSVAGYSITSSTSLNADPSVYLVTVNSGTGSGSLRLSLTDDGSISDTEASNISGTIPAGEVFQVDRTGPSATFTQKPALFSSSSSATLKFTVADTGGSSVSTIECRRDGLTYGSCGAAVSGVYTVSYTDLDAGSHSFDVRATDGLGNQRVTSYTWTIDVVPPVITITSPVAATNDTTPVISGVAGRVAGDSATVTVRVYAGADTTGSEIQTAKTTTRDGTTGVYSVELDALSPGQYTVKAEQADTSQTGFTTATFLVDTTVPTLSALSGPANPVASRSASFSFTSADPDGGAIASGIRTTPAGAQCNLSGPDADLLPSGSTGWVNCTSNTSATYSGLDDGTYTLQVRSVDVAGNTSEVQEYTWKVDVTGPAITIGTKPPTNHNSRTANFAFSITDATAPLTTTCQMDSETVTSPCTSPITYSDLTEGSHTLTITSTDALGNVGTATYTFTVDVTLPLISIDDPKPALNTQATSATFTFSATDTGGTGVVEYRCSLDSALEADFSTCTSTKTYAGPLSDGLHTFRVQAKDAAGNWSLVASYQWRVDTTKPTVTISTKPVNPISSASALFGFTIADTNGSGVQSVTCKLDTGSAVPCTYSAETGYSRSYSGLSDGEHTVLVTVTDNAGNVETASYTWRVDTTNPAVEITAGSKPSNPTTATTANFAWTQSDTDGSGVKTIECRLDSADYAACTSPKELTGLSDGLHTFSVRITDNAGNVSTDSYTWRVDTTPPSVTIATGSKPTSPTNSTSATFTFSSSDGAVGAGITAIACKLDDGVGEAETFGACTSPTSYATGTLTNREYTFTVRVTDALGYTATDSHTWIVDTVAPVITLTRDAAISDANRTKKQTPAFTFSATDGGGKADAGSAPVTFECSLDTGVSSYSTCTSPYTASTLGNGTYTFRVRATDAAGVQSTSSTTFTVDITPPTVAISVPSNNAQLNDSTPAVSGTATDGLFENELVTLNIYSGQGSGKDFLRVQPTTRSGASWSISGLAVALTDGVYTLVATQVDDVGNAGISSEVVITIDTVAPTPTVTSGPGFLVTPKRTGSTSATFGFSATDAGGLSGAGTGVPAFECSMDTSVIANFTSCVSGVNYTVTEGSRTFRVRARDGAGNWSDPVAYEFTVDTTKPVIDITAPTAAQFVNSANPTISGTAGYATGDSPTVTVKVFEGSGTGGTKVDEFTANVNAGSGAWSKATTVALANGRYTAEVTQSDDVGNAADAKTVTFVVDLVVPVASITSGPGSVAAPNRTNSTSVTFAFSATDTGGVSNSGSGATVFQCSMDDANVANFTSCTSPKTVIETEGTHVFRVRAQDGAGNWSSAVSYTFTIDVTRPANPTIASPTAGSRTANRTPTVSGTAGFATFDQPVVIDVFAGSSVAGDAVQSTTATVDGSGNYSKALATLVDGTYTIRVSQSDDVGNAALTPATRTFTV